MKILQNSDVPIYQQIAAQFQEDILTGRLKQGEYLPSIRGLAKELRISVITTMRHMKNWKSRDWSRRCKGRATM